MAGQDRELTRLTTVRLVAEAQEMGMVCEMAPSPAMEGNQAHDPLDMEGHRARGPAEADMDARQALDTLDMRRRFLD